MFSTTPKLDPMSGGFFFDHVAIRRDGAQSSAVAMDFAALDFRTPLNCR